MAGAHKPSTGDTDGLHIEPMLWLYDPLKFRASPFSVPLSVVGPVLAGGLQGRLSDTLNTPVVGLMVPVSVSVGRVTVRLVPACTKFAASGGKSEDLKTSTQRPVMLIVARACSGAAKSAGTSTVITNLTHHSYTFTVRAVTGGGAGPPSQPSNAVMVKSVPSAPAGVTAKGGDLPGTDY